MKGIIVNRDGVWKIANDSKDLPVHPDDLKRNFKHGDTVEFDIVPIEKRQLREFAGSFNITVENVAKIR
jgi:hypothetical protein